jgi:hypothetical protein
MTGAETALLVGQMLSLLIRLATETKDFADMLSRAQAEGRDLTPEEMSKIRNSRLAAMARWDEEGNHGTQAGTQEGQ